MDFRDYVGKPIVLITNEVNTQKELANIALPGTTYLIHSLGFPRADITGGKYCIVRNLVSQDLEDEDFSTCLKNMWKIESKIQTYLNSCTIMKEIST